MALPPEVPSGVVALCLRYVLVAGTAFWVSGSRAASASRTS